MRRALGVLLAAAVPVAAWGQSPAPAPIVATPLPPIGQAPNAPSAPQAPTAPAPTPTPAAPAPAAIPWLPQGNAVLQVLDKVNAQSQVLTVKVGQSVKFGTLTIQVQACDIRPPDQPQDATAFLSITDGQAGAPAFTGWMVAGNPSLSMLQHPIYDVRVLNCKA